MRYILPMLAVASLTALAGPANSQGQNSRWCADYGRDSSTNCGFVTYEQCRATIAGFNQGTCYRNPHFTRDQPRY